MLVSQMAGFGIQWVLGIQSPTRKYMGTTMKEVLDVLVQRKKYKGHHLVVVEVQWGNLPPRVIELIGRHQVLQYVCHLLATCDEKPPEFWVVDVQSLMESAAECSDGSQDTPVSG